jgi:hypothetical protein
MNTRIALTSVTCFIGAAAGLLISPLLIEWFAAAFRLPLLETNTFFYRTTFAAGCALLFASAPITAIMLVRLSKPYRWILAYLALGCFGSTMVAFYFRASIASGVSSLGGLEATSVSLRAFPNFIIPLSGVLVIITFGLFHRLLHRVSPQPR